MGSRYEFVSRWEVAASAEDCWRELERMLGSEDPGPQWWPGVSITVAPAALTKDETFTLVVRSPFGYRLRVRLRITEIQAGRRIAARGDGDLRGDGELEIESRGEASRLVIRWNVETVRAWMNVTAWMLRPVFERAHARIMAAGERGLREHLR